MIDTSVRQYMYVSTKHLRTFLWCKVTVSSKAKAPFFMSVKNMVSYLKFLGEYWTEDKVDFRTLETFITLS